MMNLWLTGARYHWGSCSRPEPTWPGSVSALVDTLCVNILDCITSKLLCSWLLFNLICVSSRVSHGFCRTIAPCCIQVAMDSHSQRLKQHCERVRQHPHSKSLLKIADATQLQFTQRKSTAPTVWLKLLLHQLPCLYPPDHYRWECSAASVAITCCVLPWPSHPLFVSLPLLLLARVFVALGTCAVVAGFFIFAQQSRSNCPGGPQL